MVAERRKKIRRISDVDCSQCKLWGFEINRIKQDYHEQKESVERSIIAIHERINSSLPRWVFLLIMACYFGIATYNAISIKALSVDIATVQTRVEAIEANISKIKR